MMAMTTSGPRGTGQLPNHGSLTALRLPSRSNRQPALARDDRQWRQAGTAAGPAVAARGPRATSSSTARSSCDGSVFVHLVADEVRNVFRVVVGDEAGDHR